LIASVPVFWVAPDIFAVYAIAYLLVPDIRKFTVKRVGSISENLEANSVASLTVFTLIIATVAILATVGTGHLGNNIRVGYEWLAAATVFSLAQFLLTRQVTAWTTYSAVAATDSLWWCLSWSIWAVYDALLPDDGWIFVLAIAPFGVALTSVLNLNSMKRAGRKTA
jgi:hypothetical protein